MNIVTVIEQLRRPTEWVKDNDDIGEVVDNLFKGLKEFKEIYNTLGLAANQLGYNLRIFVMVMTPSPPICIVNPILHKEKGHQVRSEGCLSLPGVVVKVKRPQQVVIKGLNQYRKPVKYRLRGQRARIACDELDHLAGKLIIDYR